MPVRDQCARTWRRGESRRRPSKQRPGQESLSVLGRSGAMQWGLQPEDPKAKWKIAGTQVQPLTLAPT